MTQQRCDKFLNGREFSDLSDDELRTVLELLDDGTEYTRTTFIEPARQLLEYLRERHEKDCTCARCDAYSE